MKKINIVDVKPFLTRVLIAHVRVLKGLEAYDKGISESEFLAILDHLHKQEIQKLSKEDAKVYQLYEAFIDNLLEKDLLINLIS